MLQDYKNITAGAYKLPWDMTTTGHRQWNPLHLLRTSQAFISEAVSTLERRNRGSPEDVWLCSPLYPEYYMNTFHYQVSHSAQCKINGQGCIYSVGVLRSGKSQGCSVWAA